MKLVTSIKHQAIIAFTGFALGLTALFLVLAVVTAFIVEDELLSRLLKQEANYLEQQYSQTGVLPEPRLDFMAAYSDYSMLPSFAQQALSEGITDNEIFTPTQDHFHIVELTLGDRVGYLMAEVSALLIVTTTPGVFQTFLYGLLVTLILAILFAITMASWTVKPVMAMVTAIERKQTMPELKFELGYLSKSMQSAFDELSESLRREKDFTRDVSHELRTPLTILNNTVTLARQRGLQASELAQLEKVGQDMLNTVEVLLALARSEKIEQQHCLLKPMLEQVGMECALALNLELDLQLNLDNQLSVRAPQSLLNLLFTNIINNAIVHGSDYRLTVDADEHKLSFYNHVDVETKLQETQIEVNNFRKQGIGQGLYLITRIIEALGWQHQLKQSSHGFTLIISL